MTSSPVPLRIWPVAPTIEGAQRAEFAVANAIVLARRAEYVLRPLMCITTDILALVELGTCMRLLFSQGNPEEREIAGQDPRREAA